MGSARIDRTATPYLTIDTKPLFYLLTDQPRQRNENTNRYHTEFRYFRRELFTSVNKTRDNPPNVAGFR